MAVLVRVGVGCEPYIHYHVAQSTRLSYFIYIYIYIYIYIKGLMLINPFSLLPKTL